jgi:hypothetical protein
MGDLDSVILYATLKTILSLGMGAIAVTVMLKLRSRYGKKAVLAIPGCIIGGLLAIIWAIMLIEFIKKGNTVGIIVCALIPAIITGIVFLVLFLRRIFKEKQAVRTVQQYKKSMEKKKAESQSFVLKPDIREKAVERMLENNGLTAAEMAAILSEENEDEQTSAIRDACRLLGVSAENGRLRLDPVFQSSDLKTQAGLKNLMDSLDCKVNFTAACEQNSKVRYLD